MPPPYEEVGGDAADEISFVLVVRDVDDLLAAPYVEAPFTLYPTGLSPDEVVYPVRRTDPLEQVMVDDDGLFFALFGFGEDGLDGYLENRTDRALTFELTDVRMDGRPLEPLWAGAIPAGKRAYVKIPFDLDGLDDGAIANAQAVAFTLRAYEDWDDPAPREYAVYEELVYVPRAYGEGPAASERAVS